MAKPYLIYKKPNGFYYAELLLPDGTHANRKSTGCKNRADAEKVVMGWIVNGNIPERTNSRKEKNTSVDKISFFNNLRNYDFNEKEIEKIAQVLKDRDFIKSYVLSASTKQTRPFKEFIEEFWDYDKSPYVREKLSRKQSIHRDYCVALLTRIKKYWYPTLEKKMLGEITREDITAIFTDETVSKLSPKTINSIISAITIPMKWAFFHGYTDINCYEGIIKCSAKSPKRKVLTLEQAMAVFCTDWENDSARLANMIAFYTGMRQGEIAALRLEDIGLDRIYIRHSWSKYEGLKETKTNTEREMKIPNTLRDMILFQAKMNPYNEGLKGFVFYGLNPGKPTDPKNWLKYLHRALHTIGYSNPEEICFHAWRHLWCSRVSDLIQDKRVVMTGSGHSTEFMLDHYSEHMEKERALDKLRVVQEQLFLPIINKAEHVI